MMLSPSAPGSAGAAHEMTTDVGPESSEGAQGSENHLECLGDLISTTSLCFCQMVKLWSGL